MTNVFKDAFLADYFLIYAFLKKEAVKVVAGRFWQTDEASKLLHDFDNCNSFEEIHDCLLRYVNTYPNTPFTAKLVQLASNQAFYDDFVLRR